MKQFITLLLPLFLLAGTLSAQQTASRNESHALDIGTTSVHSLSLAVKNYCMGLEALNERLLESSLYYAVCLRLKFPEETLSALKKSN